MRIALIAPPWTPVPPTRYGGIELVVDMLATGFQQAGHEVMLYTTGDSTCPVPKGWVMPSAPAQIGSAVAELRHVMNAYEAVRDYDIVHDHTVMGPAYSEHFDGMKVVTTAHGPFVEDLADIYRRVAPTVPLIAISNAQRRPVPDIPIVRVIHHGVKANSFPFGHGKGGYCLFLGRMSPDKGAHRATEAAFKANVPLILAAKMREQAEIEYFEANVKPYLNEDIRYVGEVSLDEKLELLANARCLLFPIRWNEPFGMVMLEAMACGTPVIAFPEGAAPEVVDEGRTGFLCDNIDDMAATISRLDSIDRAACRAAAEGYFSSERMVAEHLELFEQIIAS
ncbi:MAG: glycosyltransferase family 4 protein [Actinobacteria bacterium]|nr:MAG: glycosyltransferase family 4 protein [Actinomycetota bacterium]